MEIFLIILGIILISTLLTLITSCIANITLNPFRYFKRDWDSFCFPICWVLYMLMVSLFSIFGYHNYKEKPLHYIKTEWDEKTGYYNITVSGSELKGVNIIQEEN